MHLHLWFGGKLLITRELVAAPSRYRLMHTPGAYLLLAHSSTPASTNTARDSRCTQVPLDKAKLGDCYKWIPSPQRYSSNQTKQHMSKMQAPAGTCSRAYQATAWLCQTGAAMLACATAVQLHAWPAARPLCLWPCVLPHHDADEHCTDGQ
jgi:hypothetical protein